MSSHARFSPSSSERWINCPGSISAQEAVADDEQDESSLASRTGTAAHALLEICIILAVKPEGFIGMQLEPGCPVIDDKMADTVNLALDWLEEYIDEHGAENLIVMPERKVYIGPMIGLTAEECNGTSDLSIVHKDRSMLTTADLKNGRMAVSPKDNPQLMLYTAGDINELGGLKYKKYRNVIIQPNAAQRRPINEYEYTHPKLVKFLKVAENAAALAKLDDAPRNAGDWCFYCRGKNNCQTRRRKAMASAADDFGVYKDPETIEVDDIQKVLEEAAFLKAYVASVEARALKLAIAGQRFKGFEVGYGRRVRQFDDVEQVREWCKKNRIPEDVYAPRSFLSPPGLESALRKMGRIAKKKRNEERQPSPLEAFVSLSMPKPVLKRTGAPDASEDFDDLDSVD